VSRYACEFRGKIYVPASAKDMAAFLMRPTEWLSSGGLPTQLPRHATEASDYQMEPEHWAELSGFCPVHLFYGPRGGDYYSRGKAMVPGQARYCVDYRSALYCLADEESFQAFMAKPFKFASVELPAKLPQKAAKLTVASLPMRGFLEQALGDSLIAALTKLAARPKHPTLSCRKTALQLVAMHLKANNPKLRAPHLKHKYGAKLHEFSQECSLIDLLLGQPHHGPAPADLDDESRRLLKMWGSVVEHSTMPE